MFNRLFNSTYTLETSSGNVQPTFHLNLHIGAVQWERSIDFSPQPTHWRRPVGMFNRLFNSAYTLETSTGTDRVAFRLYLHTGSFQWESSIGFSPLPTHQRLTLGPIACLFVSTY